MTEPDLTPQSPRQVHDMKLAMKLSFGIGILMFFGKTAAYLITGSAAILSDAAESVVHVAAVGFAAYSLWLSFKPLDERHQYGHDKIQYFSAGFEGGMIVIAAFYIIYSAIDKWITGEVPTNLGRGTLIVTGAGLLNGALGAFLVWTGRRNRSLILIANGKHVLTDCYTSLGVIFGLLLVTWTGVWQLDPILAIAVAVNILWTGFRLMRQAWGGLMDEADPQVSLEIERLLDERTRSLGIEYHGLRHRLSGNTIWVDLHLIFPGDMSIRRAHEMATHLETEIEQHFPQTVEVSSHLEAREDHEHVHPREHFVGFDRDADGGFPAAGRSE